MSRILTPLATLALLFIALACGSTSPGPMTLTALPSSPTPTDTPVSSIATLTPSPISTPAPSPTPRPPTPTPVEGPGYGGHFIDPEDDSIVYIYLVNPSQEAAEQVARTHISSLVYKGMKKIREVRPVQAHYTFRQLKRWYDQLLDSGIWDIPELTMSDVNEGINRLEFGVDCEANRDRVQREVQEILLQENIPVDAVKVTVRGRAYPTIVPPPFECAPPEVIDPVTELSSPGFGGLFFDRDSRTVNVYMLDPSQEKAEDLALAIVGRDTLERYPNVRAIQGQYTWKQLLEWRHSIRDSNSDIPGVNLFDVYPDQNRNRLRAEIDRDRSPAVETEFEDLLKQIGVPRKAVILLE